MAPYLSCPPRNVWQRLLEDGFTEAVLGEWAQHLERCALCQATVEGLIGGLSVVAELRKNLPPASEVCQRKLEDLKEK